MSNQIPKGTDVDGDMTTALDSRFLNSIVLRGALAKADKDHLIVTIDRVEFHKLLKYENGQKDPDVYLLYFVGSDKPLKLAKTNTKRIINIHGTLGKGWHGKKLALHIEQDRRPDLGGKGPCVRVKNIDPATGLAPAAW
tara:strand:- start:777 stop:1193 length:417 start_codon:yes stop_codon:yes gene_type:complete